MRHTLPFLLQPRLHNKSGAPHLLRKHVEYACGDYENTTPFAFTFCRRVTYKTLNLLDYILRHGSDRVIEDARDHLREIKKLQKFEYVDSDGKDQGINIREKARQLVELLNSDEQLNAEREKARATRNKYSGVSAAEMSSGTGGAQQRESRKGFSDDDFKYASDRGRQSSNTDIGMGLTSIVGGLVSSASEYAAAASKQFQSMQTLFPSNELEGKLTSALSNDPNMPSTALLYDLGRATHREDDYRLILAAIWQNVLRSNQRPRVMLKTLMVLESVLLHGPERAIEETLDMKTDIKVLQSFSSPDFNEAGKVQAKAAEIVDLLENNGQLTRRREESADSFSGNMGKYQGFSADTAPRLKTNGASEPANTERWNAPDADFDAAFESPAPAPPPVDDLFDVASPAPAPSTPAPASGASGLSANIGSIKVNLNREGRERNRSSSSTVSLDKLPTPAAPAGLAAPPAPAVSTTDDLFGLLDTPAASATALPSAPPPGAMAGTDDLFGMLGSGGGAVMAAAGGVNNLGADFGDFDSALSPASRVPALAGPPSAAAMLESALNDFSMDSTPSMAPAAPAPAPAPKLGPGSGLGLASISQMQAQPQRPIAGPTMGGMGMGGPPMGGMGMGGPPMGGMGMGGMPMGGMGMAGPPMGGMGMGGTPMGGMGMGGPIMGGMGGGMGGRMSTGSMSSCGMGSGMAAGNGIAGTVPMGGMGASVQAPAPAPAPDPFANLMK